MGQSDTDESRWPYFFGFGLVCAKALPATDFAALLLLLLRRMRLAVLATRWLVCFLFSAIRITSFQGIGDWNHLTIDMIPKKRFPVVSLKDVFVTPVLAGFERFREKKQMPPSPMSAEANYLSKIKKFYKLSNHYCS